MASRTADQLNDIAQTGVDPASGSYLSSRVRKAVFRRSLISRSKVFAKPGALAVRPSPIVRITPQQLAVAKQSTEEDRTQTISLQNIISQIGALRNQVLKLSANFAQLSKMVLQTAQVEEDNEKAKYLLARRQMERERKREKENIIEKALASVVLEPVKKVGKQAQNALLGLLNFFSILFVGWLTNQSLELIKAESEGNVEKVKEITGQIVKNVGIVLGTLGTLHLAMTAIPAALGGITGVILGFIGKKVVKGFFEWIKKNLWDKFFPPKPPVAPPVAPPAAPPFRTPKITTGQFLEELRRRMGQKVGLPYQTTLNKDQLEQFDDLMRIVRQQQKAAQKAGQDLKLPDALKKAQEQLFGKPLETPKINLPAGIFDEALINKLPGWMKGKKFKLGANIAYTIASALGMGYLMEKAENWSYDRATEFVRQMYPYLNEKQSKKVLESYSKTISDIMAKQGTVGGALEDITRWVGGFPSLEKEMTVQKELLENLITQYAAKYKKDPTTVAKEIEDFINKTAEQTRIENQKKDGGNSWNPGGYGGPDLESIDPNQGRNDAYALPFQIPNASFIPMPKVGDIVGGEPDQQQQVIYMSSGGSKPKIDAPLKSGSASKVPFIPSSNPDNMYTLYSQVNYNVVM